MSNGSGAMSRITALLDDNSFVELQSLVTARSTEFNLDAKMTPSDGVIIGHGLIDGSLVFVFSQDASVLKGSLGEMHAKKILSVYDMALKAGAPIIGLLDCSGVRLNESFDALEAMGSVINKAAMASGVIPQIMCVCGNCGGGLSVLCGLADFTYMTDDAKLYMNSPDAIKDNYASKCDTASAKFQYESTGNADKIGTEAEIFDEVRKLISILPASDTDYAGMFADTTDDLNRAAEGLMDKLADAKLVAQELSDNRLFVETMAGRDNGVVTGFIKLDGITVGVIGTKEGEDGAVICPCGVNQATDFVDFCNNFGLPILTITNLTGFAASMMSEKRIIRSLSEFVKALTYADVPKINLITKEAFGSAYALMNSKSMGADLVYALEGAKVGAMDPAKAAKIMAETGSIEDINAAAAKYEELQASAVGAASRGYIDRIVTAADCRKYIIAGLEMLIGN